MKTVDALKEDCNRKDTICFPKCICPHAIATKKYNRNIERKVEGYKTKCCQLNRQCDNYTGRKEIIQCQAEDPQSTKHQTS